MKDKRFFKFIISGGTGFVTYMAVLFLLYNKLEMNYISTVILSYFIATIANFTISKFFVFHSTSKKIISEYMKFAVIACTGMAFQTLFIQISFKMLNLNYYIANLTACLLFAFVSFELNKRITFKQ